MGPASRLRYVAGIEKGDVVKTIILCEVIVKDTALLSIHRDGIPLSIYVERMRPFEEVSLKLDKPVSKILILEPREANIGKDYKFLYQYIFVNYRADYWKTLIYYLKRLELKLS